MNSNPTTIAGGPSPLNRPPFKPQIYSPETAADVVTIQQLLARYCHALDNDSTPAAALAAMFLEDGRLIAAYEGDREIIGRAAIEGWYAQYLKASRAGSRIRRHLISTSRIEVECNRAWAFSFLDASGIQVAEDVIGVFIGAYEDDLAKVDGAWFFRSRRISLDYNYKISPYELNRNGKQAIAGGGES